MFVIYLIVFTVLTQLIGLKAAGCAAVGILAGYLFGIEKRPSGRSPPR